jgi:outer membrane PBP1 activator LpoA protein
MFGRLHRRYPCALGALAALALAALPFCVAAQVPASAAPAAVQQDKPPAQLGPLPLSGPTTPPAPTEPPPDIALLLPLPSRDFGPAADAVRRGVLAALKAGGDKLTVRPFPTDANPEHILAAYAAVVAAGARVVVGPMTRSAVSALASSALITVPTLALNTPDGDPPVPRLFYWFGLSTEAEARRMASLVLRDEQKFCFVAFADTPLARRGAQAFGEAYLAQGGKVMQTFSFNPAESAFPQIRDRLANFESGCVFLSADADQARLVRPYLSNSLTVYSTSLINTPDALPRDNIDLNGIRFVDMPWLLQPDHPAVMIYPRNSAVQHDNLERFYALGIDAYRIATELLRTQQVVRLDLDGVTGRIHMGPNNQVLREPMPATFRDGVAVPLDDNTPH